jgi:eukaryotic-like serine/threonine-protein kinase
VPLSHPDITLVNALRAQYQFERELGHGGMATVYLARDIKHDRPVAFKLLRPELAAILGAERFLREIRLTASMQHPHILPLLDSGQVKGFLYYVMPYVEGESLRQRLDREGQLPLADTLVIAGGIASALDYAHRLNVIHRDIKPENILLYQGEPMVADFGIALAASAAGKERLTGTGLSLGTPAYMSPEQASASSKLDGRSDQYSLACVVYEMLAGEPPYTGPTAQAIIAKRFSEPVPNLGTVRAVPAGVSLAVKRALSKSPADRFSSTGEFINALQREPPQRLVTRRMAATLGVVSTLAALALLAFLLRPRTPAGTMTTRQVTFTGKATQPSLSPDGKRVAYVSGNRSLVVQELAGGEPLVLVPPARFLFNPVWTYDGSTLVFHMFRDSAELAATYTVPSHGGSSRRALEDFVPMDAGPDPNILVRAPRQKHRLDFIDLSSGKTLRQVALPDSFAELGRLEWSPNGRFVALDALDAVWTMPASGGIPNRIVSLSGAGAGSSMRWSPESDALYYLGGKAGSETLFRVRLNRRSGTRDGEPIRVAALPGVHEFDIRAGQLVYTRENTSEQARVFEYAGRPRHLVQDRLLTEGSAAIPWGGVSISADGRWVAYSQERGGDANIYVVPASGGAPRAVAATSASERVVRWSPDGSRLAYTREDSTGKVVMVTDVSTGVSQRASSIPGPYANFGEGWSLWSADGKHLSYYERDLRRIVVVDLERQEERELVIPDSIGTGYVRVIPSPDGRQVVASTIKRQTDWGELWLASVDGHEWRKLAGPFGESWPLAYGKDGWLYVQNTRGILADYGTFQSELWRIPLAGGKPEFLAPVPEGCAIGVDLAENRLQGACTQVHINSDLFLASGLE